MAFYPILNNPLFLSVILSFSLFVSYWPDIDLLTSSSASALTIRIKLISVVGVLSPHGQAVHLAVVTLKHYLKKEKLTELLNCDFAKSLTVNTGCLFPLNCS